MPIIHLFSINININISIWQLILVRAKRKKKSVNLIIRESQNDWMEKKGELDSMNIYVPHYSVEFRCGLHTFISKFEFHIWAAQIDRTN